MRPPSGYQRMADNDASQAMLVFRPPDDDLPGQQQALAPLGVTSNHPGGDAIRRQRTWAPGLIRAQPVLCQLCCPRRVIKFVMIPPRGLACADRGNRHLPSTATYLTVPPVAA